MKLALVVWMGFVCPLMSCTSILVTKGASVDGSVFVTHSDDNSLSDPRIIYVPANDYPKGAKRAVYYDAASFGTALVRYVGTSRGPHYEDPSQPQSVPLGYIDQVSHTYAYFDGSYGIMNEHQLMIGETTCGAKVELKPKEGERIFYSAELSRIALERCTMAREAVKLMGELIDKYGYYGPGETLLIGDKEEGWVFEMCGGTADGRSGLWVAKKVPDGEVFVSANEFRIRDVDPQDPDMLYSKNLFEEVQQRGWWNPKEGKLDWLRAVSYGEMDHPYHALRRVWRIFSRIKPSAHFSAWVKDGYTKEYPFSIKPDQKIGLSDVMDLYRDHYEGTEFDLTKGVSAGPFGCPDRYAGPYDGHSENVTQDKAMCGAWERPISNHNCGFVYINQARSRFPDPIGGICWFGADEPYTTCFVPFFVGVSDLPNSYQIGNCLDFNQDSAWWVFNFVNNWAVAKFSYMKQDIISLQKTIENQELAEISQIDVQSLALFQQNPNLCTKHITDCCIQNSNRVLQQWRNLSKQLIVKYNKGFINKAPKFGEEVGYSEEWLKSGQYKKGPVSYKKQ